MRIPRLPHGTGPKAEWHTGCSCTREAEERVHPHRAHTKEASSVRGYVLVTVLLVLVLLAFPLAALMHTLVLNAKQSTTLASNVDCTSQLQGALGLAVPVAKTAVNALPGTSTEAEILSAVNTAVCALPGGCSGAPPVPDAPPAPGAPLAM